MSEGVGLLRPGTALLDKSYKYMRIYNGHFYGFGSMLCSHGLHLFDQK